MSVYSLCKLNGVFLNVMDVYTQTHTYIYMLYINHSKEVYMANILPETEVRGSLQ